MHKLAENQTPYFFIRLSTVWYLYQAEVDMITWREILFLDPSQASLFE